MTSPSQQLISTPEDVLKFWYEEITPQQWWRSADLDDTIRERFLPTYETLSAQIPGAWLSNAKGSLAAIIVLDQFPRNLFRNTAKAYATDADALEIASQSIEKGFDKELDDSGKLFMYMPYQHSESLTDQERSLQLYATLDNDGSSKSSQQHKDIIEKFGRFPHRNEHLGRTSTQEEIDFLSKGSLFW